MPDKNRRAYLARRRAELFKEQRGDCYWCHKPMILLDKYHEGTLEPNTCTLDHLFDRSDERRYTQKQIKRYVASCWRCNHDRGVQTTLRMRKASLRAKRLGCSYCEGAGPEPGALWTDNNGPIVDCPRCNDNSPNARRQREFEAAERQRKAVALPRPQSNTPETT